MKLIRFPEVTAVYAEDQPEYQPLPCWRDAGDPRGQIICCWRLTFLERVRVLLTGRIWHSILTFRKPLQPQMLSVWKPDMVPVGTPTNNYPAQGGEGPGRLREDQA